MHVGYSFEFKGPLEIDKLNVLNLTIAIEITYLFQNVLVHVSCKIGESEHVSLSLMIVVLR